MKRILALTVAFCMLMMALPTPIAAAASQGYELIIPFYDSEFPNEDICGVNEEHGLFISQVWSNESPKRLYNFEYELLMEADNISFGDGCILVKNGKWGAYSFELQSILPHEYDDVAAIGEGRILALKGKSYSWRTGWSGDVYLLEIDDGELTYVGEGTMASIIDDNPVLKKSFAFGGDIGLQIIRTSVMGADGSWDLGHRVANSCNEYVLPTVFESVRFGWDGRIIRGVPYSHTENRYFLYSGRGRFIAELPVFGNVTAEGEYYFYNDTLNDSCAVYDINGNRVELPAEARYIEANSCETDYIKPNAMGNSFGWDYVQTPVDDSRIVLIRGVGAIKLPQVYPEPSRWAHDDAKRAMELGIADEEIRWWWRDSCTREEFCRMLIRTLESITGKTADELSKAENAPEFADCDEREVKVCAALGIVNGVGSNRFAPANFISRQQAATMLSRAADFLGYQANAEPMSFTDADAFADWAVEAIAFVSSLACGQDGELLMQGKSGNFFAPEETYTVEQAITTLLRLIDK